MKKNNQINKFSQKVGARVSHRIFAPIALLLSAAISALVFSLSYNADTRYIVTSPISIAFYAIIIAELAAAILFASSYFQPTLTTDNGTFTRISALILHIAVIICGAMVMATSKNMVFSIDALKSVGNNRSSFRASDLLKAILLLSSASIFTSSPSLRKTRESYGTSCQIHDYSTIFFCISAIALLYFDMSVEMNNPQKMLMQFALSSICLMTLYKMKWNIQGNSARISRLFELFTIILAPAASISTFIAMSERSNSLPAPYFYLAIAVAAYAIDRAVAIIAQKEK